MGGSGRECEGDAHAHLFGEISHENSSCMLGILDNNVHCYLSTEIWFIEFHGKTLPLKQNPPFSRPGSDTSQSHNDITKRTQRN